MTRESAPRHRDSRANEAASSLAGHWVKRTLRAFPGWYFSHLETREGALTVVLARNPGQLRYVNPRTLETLYEEELSDE